MFRINELVRVVKDWQRATVLTYASSSHPWKTLEWGGRAKKDLRYRGGKVRRGPMSIVGWSDAAFGTSRLKGSAS